MPIVVKHAPNQVLVGLAGLAAGYGGFQKDQIEIQQRQQQLNLQQQAQAEQARRYQQGIFQDERQDLRRLAASQQQQTLNRQHDFDLGEDRFQQQAALAEFDLAKRQDLQEAQFAQQQDLAQQRALSNAEILAQRAEQQYQAKVNKSLQQFEWEPWQQREINKVQEQRQKILSRANLDQAQKADAILQLEDHQHKVIGYPQKRKVFPTIDEQFATGQSKWITDPETGARAIASFDRNGAPRYTFVPDKQAQARQEQTREHDAKVKDWERRIKYQTERRTWIDERARQLSEPELDNRPAAMSFAEARRQAESEVDRFIPPPPAMPLAPESGPSMGPQPQSRGLPPIPQEWMEWQAGMQPQQGPQPQAAPQQQSEVQQPAAQQPARDAKSVIITSSSGKQYSLQQIRDLANKLGVPVEQVLQDFGINPQELGM